MKPHPSHLLLAALFLASVPASLLAEPPANITTGKNGATVLYTTPLANGATGNALLGDKPVTFSKKAKAGPHLLVIDLGKAYQFNTVKLKFSKPADVKLFVVKNKPDGTTNWNQLVEGMSPDGTLDDSGKPVSLSGANGQYLVIVSDKDPGTFSGLYVTGTPFNPNHGGPAFANGILAPIGGGQTVSSGLYETPPPASAYQPGVPNQSN